MEDLILNSHQINEQLARYGVKFGIYKNGVFNERLFPYDPIPRIISAGDWENLSKGLVQRVTRNCQMLWMKNPEICLGCNL